MNAGEWSEIRPMVDLTKRQSESRLQRSEGMEAKRMRRLVNRRKYVVGGAMLMLASKDPEWRETLKRVLGTVTRDSDMNEVRAIYAEIKDLEKGLVQRLSY